MFFGRMFSHVLRAFMVWLVVLSPLLGYITLKGTSVTRIVLDGQEADLEVTATFLVAVLWCLMSVSCVVYTAIKMARFGKKIESIGTSAKYLSAFAASGALAWLQSFEPKSAVGGECGVCE